MDKWDDAKLAQVVLSKAGNPRTTTDVGPLVRSIEFDSMTRCYSMQIVCKHFIQAIETQKFVTFTKPTLFSHYRKVRLVLGMSKR
jgi:hypothetical protein